MLCDRAVAEAKLTLKGQLCTKFSGSIGEVQTAERTVGPAVFSFQYQPVFEHPNAQISGALKTRLNYQLPGHAGLVQQPVLLTPYGC